MDRCWNRNCVQRGARFSRIAQEKRKLAFERAQQIMELPLEYVPNEQFEPWSLDRKTENEVLGPMPACDGLLGNAQPPSGVAPYVASLYEVPLLTREQEVHLFRKLILHKNGGVRWLRNTIVQRRDETDRLVGYDGLVEDVTQRREAEEALRDREAHLLAAEAIQARLWPEAPPALPGFDIAGASYPAEFAAGDYFDYIPMLDGSIGFVIGDVSGHGLGPAIVMALTYAHLRSLAQVCNGIDEILTRVNQFLVNETDHFVTLFFGRLMPETRSFVAVNAGHPSGLVLDSSGRIKAQIESTTPPLAVLPNAVFSFCNPVTLEPGDLVLLLTDGIHEAKSPAGLAFGRERTLQVVRANRDRPAAEIIQAIHDAVQAFCRPGKPADDITAIVIKVRSEGNA